MCKACHRSTGLKAQVSEPEGLASSPGLSATSSVNVHAFPHLSQPRFMLPPSVGVQVE